MTNESKVAHQIFSEEYTKIVKEKYPQKSHSWPILSGYDVLGGQFGNYIISIFKDTGNPAMMSSGFIDLEFLSEYVTDINSSNVEMVRDQIGVDLDEPVVLGEPLDEETLKSKTTIYRIDGEAYKDDTEAVEVLKNIHVSRSFGAFNPVEGWD